MRILMLEPIFGEQHSGLSKRCDHCSISVSLFTLIRDYSPAFETRRGRGKRTILVNGIRNRGIDAPRFERARVRHPDVEVLAAVAGRGVDEAGAGIVGDVIAGEERDIEVVTFATEGVRAHKTF